MKYCVDIRELKSGNTVETILTTEDHEQAYRIVNEYNKEYGIYNNISKKYPKENYFVDVYQDETL